MLADRRHIFYDLFEERIRKFHPSNGNFIQIFLNAKYFIKLESFDVH